MDAKQEIEKLIETKKQEFIDVSNEVWEACETRFALKESVKSFYKVLEKEDFSIDKGIANMDYSFVATYGSGKPVIGILAEYDSLGNLSQVADCGDKRPLVKGGNGHGCGHNLLGTGALAGAVGIKDYMKAHNLKGTIKLFGCPAEESGYGKAFMVRDGVFDCLDIALAWHPADISSVTGASSLAVYQAYFNFKGVAAHASAAPEQGRSALDAAELMNIGVQFLREHIVDSARIHYAFLDAGGESANVVQPTASLFYFVRAKTLDQARNIFRRVENVARGAAMMTGTDLDIDIDCACANYVPNKVLSIMMDENLRNFGSLNLTKEDLEYEKRYFDPLSDAVKEAIYNRTKAAFSDLSEEEIRKIADSPVTDKIFPLVFSDDAPASTDVGDVSWVAPTAQINVACEPQGTPPHSWQWVANGKSDVAHKGMLAAGKTIATTAYDVLTNPNLVEKAKAEHKEMLGGKKFVSGIPTDVMPHQ